jgi:uncharacterized membrane protein
VRRLLPAFAFVVVVLPLTASAQTTGADTVVYEKAQVTQVLSSEVKQIPGTATSQNYQTLTAQILEGPDAGKTVTIDNDYLTLKVGDLFYARHEVNVTDNTDYYSMGEPYRLPVLEVLAGLFLLCALVFGGMQGLRGLLALAASIFFICCLLLPGILHGYNPVLVSMSVASLIVVAGSYITHGFNRTTTAAVLGMLAAILLTGALSWWAVYTGHFSGYTSEEVTYLNFDTQGSINFVGLLLGSLMIGLLGVLYDAAISQSIAVEELLHASGHTLTRRALYLRGLRIGREHIGALVNTLAIAYVGASLPLLLLFELTNTQPLSVTVNQELFATELVRMMVGSIGLILAVPLTTLVSVWMLHGKKSTPRREGEGHMHAHRH